MCKFRPIAFELSVIRRSPRGRAALPRRAWMATGKVCQSMKSW